MGSTFDNLNEKFDIVQEEEEVVALTTTTPPEPVATAKATPAEDALDDIEFARQALRRTIKNAEDGVDGIANIASQSDHPRAFEVLSQLLRTVAETANDLVALHKNKKAIVAPGPVEGQATIGKQTNNIVFNGSTADLLKALKANEIKEAEYEVVNE